jgi:hypothetical protein
MVPTSAAASSALVHCRPLAPAIVRVEDVDIDLVVDCLRSAPVDKAVTLVGIALGTAIVFPVLDWAAAAAPLATALGVVGFTAAATGLLWRAEHNAKVGLGAALVARGVSVDVATVFVRAERSMGIRQHFLPARPCAAALRDTAIRLAARDDPAHTRP